MFIYILNILNDSLRRNEHDNNFLPAEILKDAKYIVELGRIDKELDFKIISNRLNNVVELLWKYNLSFRETMNTLSKLLNNKKNMWILEYFNTSSVYSSNIIFSSAINEILQKARDSGENRKMNYLAL